MNGVTVSDGQKRLDALLPVLEEHRAFRAERYPVRSNWASKMGHACERYLYYLRHDWDKASIREWKGIGIRGNLIADWWKRYMQEKGFKVVLDQMPINPELAKKFEIGGKIDGCIGWSAIKPLPYEFKTMSEPYYSKINTYQDFFESKADWIKGYPAQLQLYLKGTEEEAGLFVLCNPDTLEWKTIPVYADLEYQDWLLIRADRINKANREGNPPARIAFSRTCERCDFAGICLPDIKNEGFDLVEEENLQALVEERAKLKASKERFDEVDDLAKTLSRQYGKDFILGSGWKVEVKTREGVRIDTKLIPIEERPKYEVQSTVTTVKFIPITEAKI